MKPIQAFENRLSRARKQIYLYRAFINTRSRKVNKNWLGAFKNLMSWSYKEEIKRIDSEDAILVLKSKSKLDFKDFSKESLDDLLRGSLSLGISALDRYVHERVIKNIIPALKSKDLNKEQKDFNLPVSVFINIAEKISKNKTGKNVRLANEIRNEIQDLLHKKPFQSWREIQYAFNLINISIDKEVQNIKRIKDIKLIRDTVNKIARRRNEIVHEGDLVKHERGGKVKMNKIDDTEVEDYLNFIADLVKTLELIK